MATKKLTTTLKTILIFLDGELITACRYRTKKETIGNYRLFLKYGAYNPKTGEITKKATFELL